MFPEFELLGRELYMYPLLSILGILLMGFFTCRMARQKGLDENSIIVFLLLCGIGVLLGSHILYGITNIKYWYMLFKPVASIGQWFRLFWSIFGGAVFYGGLIGGIIAAFICFRNKKWSYNDYSDIIAPGIPLFHSIARIGCFLSGCCYGITSDFGFVFSDSMSPGANDVCRFPVQLLESALNLILFFVLWYLLRKGILKGYLLPLYLCCYSLIRFCDEFLRGDWYRGFILGISTSQFISILLFISSLTLIFIRRHQQLQQ